LIRDATIADVGAIGQLIKDLAEYEHMLDEVEWDLEQLGSTLFGPDAVPFTLVAVSGSEVVGIAICYRTYSTFQARPGIWLEDLFVQPSHRGAGHGKALLEAVFARADGGRVEWSVLDWNEPSIQFYEALGARPVPGWTRYRWLADG
jgi:GNAT superfamily N-acetyltransferase